MSPATNVLKRHRVDISRPNRIEVLPSKLAADGISVLDGVDSRAELLELARSLGTIVPHRDSGADGITTIANLGKAGHKTGYGGFSTRALSPHTDRAGIAEPPALLLIACGHASSSGGECVVIDGRAVYADLAETEPDAVQALSKPRSVLFGGAAGYLGAVFEHGDDGRVAVRFRTDSLARFSPETQRWLPALRAAIDRHTTVFSLEAGQGYILHNQRWLHGRRAFTGCRVMYRVNVNPSSRLRIPAGFVPL